MKNERFFNPHAKILRKSAIDLFLWKVGFYGGKTFKKLPGGFKYPQKEQTFDNEKNSVVWINHCSFLIKTKNATFLTDPFFSQCCSPISFIGPRRKHKPAIEIESLPQIDYILISHNHYDHLDKKSLKKIISLNPNVKIIVPKNNKKIFCKRWLQSNGYEAEKNVFELNWWEGIKFGENIKITSVPAQHFSGRIIFDFNKSLWCGYVVEIAEKDIVKKFYFCGDTGYNEYDFKQIGEKFKKIDLAIIPIGAYAPRWFMKPIHLNPKESVKVHIDVNSKMSLGMHYKTFCLSDEPMDLPPYELYLAMKEQRLDHKDFCVDVLGKYLNW
jgi:N-acyl-phosphatidylethanolamine-hydrolysing phospholipase D